MKNLFVTLLRTQNKLYRMKIFALSKLIEHIIRVMYSSEIPIQFTVPKNIYFPHSGLGVIIHSSTIIGDNCKIGPHVVIGNTKKAKHAPIIGNNCTINTRAMIIGETILGDNCIVGAGTIIFNKRIPPNMTIIGPFAKQKKNI